MTSSLDDFLLTLGNPGRYQLFVFFVLCTTFFSASFHINSMIFLGVTPKHHCNLPQGWTWPLNESIPQVTVTGGVYENDNCHMYVDPANISFGVIPCPEGWSYLTDEWSIVRDWNLVCDEQYKVSLATTMFFGGMTVGSIFVGSLCDRLGRRVVVLSSLYAQLLVAVAIAFAPNYTWFISLRFVLGIWVQSASVAPTTLVIELFHRKYRTTAGLFVTLTFSIYLGIDTWISKQFTSWRHIQLVISLPSIATLVYFWFIPESFRWLISQNDTEEASLLAKKYIRFNAVPSRPFLRQEMEILAQNVRGNQSQPKNQCFLGLFYTPRLVIISTVNMFLWFSTYLTYYHSTYFMVNLNLNLYLNFLISAVTEFLFILLLILLMNKIGRKVVVIVTLTTTAILCLTIAILASSVEGDTGEIRMFLALLSKALAISVCNCLTVYTSELYPTTIRGLGIGSCAFWSRVSGIVGPQMVLWGSQFQESVPFFALTVLNLICALSTILLPETMNKSMPETFEDVDDLWKEGENGGNSMQSTGDLSPVKDKETQHSLFSTHL